MAMKSSSRSSGTTVNTVVELPRGDEAPEDVKAWLGDIFRRRVPIRVVVRHAVAANCRRSTWTVLPTV